MSSIPKILDQISGRHETLANPMRLLILSIVVASKTASWTEISKRLEDILGRDVNPNSMSFHVKRLVESGLIQVSGSSYKPTDKALGMVSELKELLDKVRVE